MNLDPPSSLTGNSLDLNQQKQLSASYHHSVRSLPDVLCCHKANTGCLNKNKWLVFLGYNLQVPSCFLQPVYVFSKSIIKSFALTPEHKL